MKYANLRINLSFLSTFFFIKKENQKKQWGLLDYSVKNFNSKNKDKLLSLAKEKQPVPNDH